MNTNEAQAAAAILIAGAVMNYGYALAAQALSIPVGIEFVIVAYCTIVLLVPLRLSEVLAIGFISGFLNIVTSPAHVATIAGGQAFSSAGLMAFVNLLSEPAGILVCFAAFAWLAGRVRTAAPFAAAFVATAASGLVYLAVIVLLNPGHITDWPAYTAGFLIRVGLAAITNAIIVQVIVLAAGSRVKAFLTNRAGS
jgi:hypothetical protein